MDTIPSFWSSWLGPSWPERCSHLPLLGGLLQWHRLGGQAAQFKLGARIPRHARNCSLLSCLVTVCPAGRAAVCRVWHQEPTPLVPSSCSGCPKSSKRSKRSQKIGALSTHRFAYSTCISPVKLPHARPNNPDQIL